MAAQSREKRNLAQKIYRESPLGKLAAQRGEDLRSARRALAAANRPEKIPRPRRFDSGSVQQILTVWGGR